MWYAAKIDKIDKPNCDKVKTPFIIKNVNVFEVQVKQGGRENSMAFPEKCK